MNRVRIQRKLICIYILIIGLFIIVGYSNISKAATSADDFSYKQSGTVISITKYNGLSSIVDVGEAFPDATEISISGSAFSTKTFITSILLPETVTSVGNNAFYYCTNLQTVTFSQNIENLTFGESTFEGCSSLLSLDIPDCVKVIPKKFCYNCSSLKSIFLPDSCQSIGEWAFMKCESLEQVEIPSLCTAINDDAFYECSKLSTVIFKNSENGTEGFSLGTRVFSGCKKLNEIILPAGCESIPDNTFNNCSSLRNVSIPVSCISVGAYAFSSCSSLENIELPNTCDSVGEEAFANCVGLHIVTFLNPNTSIGKDAFPSIQEAPNLIIYASQTGSVTIYAANNGISYQVNKVYSISITQAPKVSEYMYGTESGLILTDLQVEAEVSSTVSDTGYIRENVVLSDCSISSFDSSKLGKQTIIISYGGAKTSFDVYVYYDLTKSTVDVQDAVYTGKKVQPSFVVYGRENGKRLIENTDFTLSCSNNISAGTATAKLSGKGQYKGDKIVSFTILPKTISEGNTIVTVEDMDYTGSQLKPVPKVMCGTEPLILEEDYVVTYGTNINVGKGYVMIEGIGNYDGSIKKWFNINEVSGAGSTESTGSETGGSTSGSTDSGTTPAAPIVETPKKGKTYIYKNMYYKVTGSTTVTFMKPVSKKVKKITIPSKVTILGKSFKVTKINKKACSGCSKVTSVSVGNYVTTIGDEAFAKCSKLKSVTIGTGLKKLGKKTFYKDKVLKKITIKSSKLTSIGKGTLKGVKKVSIKVPKKKKKAYNKLFIKAK